MASYIEPKMHTLKAGADLSAKQFHFVKFGASDSLVVACSVLGEGAIGVLMNAPASGEAAEIALIGGGAKIKSGATIARGGEISSSASGQAAVALTTHDVMAIAMESGVSGDVIPVILVRYELN